MKTLSSSPSIQSPQIKNFEHRRLVHDFAAKSGSPFCRRGGSGRRLELEAPTELGKISETVWVNNIADFVKQVTTHKPQNSRDLLLFRGQQELWPLVPKIGRPKSVKGKRQSDLGAVEKRMFALFEQMSLPFLQRDNKDRLELLAIAQHHGLPTRLLDWTGNALAALWFAVRKAGINKQPGVVWLLNPADDDFLETTHNEIDPFAINRVLLYAPRHVTQRIIAQSGYFTVHPLSYETFSFIPLAQTSQLKGTLIPIQIPCEVFSDIRDDLERHGVSDLTMFPDLEGVCRFITWNNSLLSDESDPPFIPLNYAA